MHVFVLLGPQIIQFCLKNVSMAKGNFYLPETSFDVNILIFLLSKTADTMQCGHPVVVSYYAVGFLFNTHPSLFSTENNAAETPLWQTWICTWNRLFPTLCIFHGLLSIYLPFLPYLDSFLIYISPLMFIFLGWIFGRTTKRYLYITSYVWEIYKSECWIGI